ncbi:hypothetical protein D3C76_1717270 [compost metagenome]
MRFANVRKHVNDVLWKLEAISLRSIDHHLDPAEWLNGTSERSVSLHAYNLFLVLVNVAWSV